MRDIIRVIKLLPYGGVLVRRGSLRLFDASYYGGSRLHFLVAGAFEGRNPHPLFDTAFYLQKYPDVAAAGVNPWCHYLKHGAAEGRQPHPLFDPAFYLRRYPDVADEGVNPLLHYVTHGAFEGRKPHPLFQPDYYLSRCPDARRSGVNPLVHFLASRECASPHPLFDCASYAAANPAPGVNPLVHYVLFRQGRSEAREGRQFGQGEDGTV
ncbi:MAG: hypothetical protein M1436_06640 [Acidobacteria bacterium]|nr:hypothetical protein [Acidobacteriota bacterium]